MKQVSGADLDQFECVFIDVKTPEYQFGSIRRMIIKALIKKRKPGDGQDD